MRLFHQNCRLHLLLLIYRCILVKNLLMRMLGLLNYILSLANPLLLYNLYMDSNLNKTFFTPLFYTRKDGENFPHSRIILHLHLQVQY